MSGDAKRIAQITLDNIRDSVLTAGVASLEELDAIAAELEGLPMIRTR